MLQPCIEAGLERFDALVGVLPHLDTGELLEHGAVEALDEAVGLGRLYISGMLDAPCRKAELRQIGASIRWARSAQADRRPESRQAILGGSQGSITIEVPALAIYANPHALGSVDGGWTRAPVSVRGLRPALMGHQEAAGQRIHAWYAGEPRPFCWHTPTTS